MIVLCFKQMTFLWKCQNIFDTKSGAWIVHSIDIINLFLDQIKFSLISFALYKTEIQWYFWNFQFLLNLIKEIPFWKKQIINWLYLEYTLLWSTITFEKLVLLLLVLHYGWTYPSSEFDQICVIVVRIFKRKQLKKWQI